MSSPQRNSEIPAGPIHPMPLVRLDLIVFRVEADRLQVLLAKRQQAPFVGKLGLPGGVLRIDLDASLEAAAQRVAQERLGTTLPHVRQVVAVGGAQRDPRAPWAMTVVYRAVLSDELPVQPGKRVQELLWVDAHQASRDESLAFDHEQLVGQAIAGLRAELLALQFAPGFMPEEFTLPQLQARCEAVLGAPLNKVTFRRRIEEAGALKQVPGKMIGGAHRPAQVWRIA